MKIFYDVDTQNDFMNEDGALYVPDAELIKPNLVKLSEYAVRQGYENKKTPIIGSVDKHFGTEEYKEREGELAKWGGPFPDHCMKETKGQEKIKETKVTWQEEVGRNSPEEVAHYIPNYLDNKVKKLELVEKMCTSIPLYPVLPIPALYFEKQSYDIFTNPAFELFLELAEVKEAVVYGVATDYCVKAAVLGMQKRGIQCYVVEDAIKGVSKETTEVALKEMEKAGAKFVTTKQVLEELVK